MSEVRDNLASVGGRIEAACKRAGRDPASVQLVAVSKLQPLEKLRAALVAGQRVFGENYAQELREKADALRGDRKSTRLNSSHPRLSRMPSSA